MGSRTLSGEVSRDPGPGVPDPGSGDLVPRCPQEGPKPRPGVPEGPGGPRTPSRRPARGVDVKPPPAGSRKPQNPDFLRILRILADFGQIPRFLPGSYRAIFRENVEKWPFLAKKAKKWGFTHKTPFFGVLGRFGPFSGPGARGFTSTPRAGPPRCRALPLRAHPRERRVIPLCGVLGASPQRERLQALAPLVATATG